MDYKKLIIRGISYSQTQTGAYALLLEHKESSIKLPVVIGNLEAQSISLGLEKNIQPPRPLTHDLFSKFVKDTGYEIISVIIYQIIDGVFFSNINFRNKKTSEEIIMEARTSDAVAMAIRFDAPIYTTSQVLNEAGILLELEKIKNLSPKEPEVLGENALKHIPIEEIEKLLDQAVQNEDFDAALELQEEIKRRKKKID